MLMLSGLSMAKNLRSLCITLARLWQSDRGGLQGVFLRPIAVLLARKTTQQTARARLTTERRELCRGSLTNTVDFFLKNLWFRTLLNQAVTLSELCFPGAVPISAFAVLASDFALVVALAEWWR
jgi:hypothetical protein